MITFPVLRPEKIEKFIWSLLALAAAFVFILLIEGRILLKFVPLQVGGLNKIGEVKSVKGNAFRKLKNDSLHLPLSGNDIVFEDDLVTTDESTTLEILLVDKQKGENTLLQEPNTILRLSHDKGTLLIQLHSGNVTTNFSDDTLVKVQSGTLTKEVQIRKGTYLIKNSSAGVQITAFDSNIAVKNSLQPETTVKHTFKADVADDNTEIDNANALSESQGIDLSKFKMPMRLPYPEDHQVFLLTDELPKKLVLVAKKACDGTCHLQVACGRNVLYGKELTNGTVPLYGLELRKGSSCTEFSWNFSDEKESFERSFTVQSYSDEIFQKYINLGQAIEML